MNLTSILIQYFQIKKIENKGLWIAYLYIKYFNWYQILAKTLAKT